MLACRLAKAGRRVFACCRCVACSAGVQLVAQGLPATTNVSQPVLVSDPPETRSPVSLKAINDPDTGKAAFSFDGREDPPVIRADSGGRYTRDIHQCDVDALPGTLH